MKNKLLFVFGVAVLILTAVHFGFAEQNPSLQDELNALTAELENSGFGWLINYSLPAPQIEVYENNGSRLIALFEGIYAGGARKIYLTNLSEDENYAQDVFDLRVLNRGVEFDYIVDPSNQTDYIPVYETVSDVYHDFLWDKENIWVQVRSCDDAECSGESFVGPDGTGETWFENFDEDVNVSSNRYFQFRAFLWRNVTSDGRINESFTPKLKNVKIETFNLTLCGRVVPEIEFVEPTPPDGKKLNELRVNATTNFSYPSYGFVDLDNSLVSWWRFEFLNSTGGVIDEMGRNNGTVFGNATQTMAGRFGAGMEFDGESGVVELNRSFSQYQNNYSISAWFKTSSSSSPRQQIYTETRGLSGSGVHGPNIFITNTGVVTFDMSFSNMPWSLNRVSSAGYNDNNWHYLVATRKAIGDVFSNYTYTLYVDGISVSSLTTNASLFSVSIDSLLIGKDINSSGVDVYFFNGTLDDIMVWNRSLSAAEVAALYNLTSENKIDFDYTSKISDGNHTIKGYVVDLFANKNSTEMRTILFDTTPVTVSYVAPTLADMVNVSADSVFVNVSVSDEHEVYGVTDFDDSIVGWWRMDNLNSTGGVIDESRHCYDNETEILTEEGWKLFSELDKNEKVATLNQEIGEMEWQLPSEWQEFDNDGEMFEIELEDGSIMMVSEEHKVYAALLKKSKFEIWDSHKNLTYGQKPGPGHPNPLRPNQESLINSSVVKTFTEDCSFRCESFDQISALSASARARYGESSSSEIEDNAFLRNLLYSENGTKSIFENISFCLISKSCFDSLDLNKHSSLYLANSDLMNSGANIFVLSEENKREVTESGFISENNTLLSNTIFIVYLSNSSRSFGESCENNFLNVSFFAFLPNSTLQEVKSSSFLSFCNISSFQANSLAFSSIAFLTNPDQFISGNFFINSLISGGTDIVMDTMDKPSYFVKKHNSVEIFKPLGYSENNEGGDVYADYWRAKNNFSVLDIPTLSCFVNLFSSDQIGALFNASEREKYGTSFECGANLSASVENELNSLNGTVSICVLRKENISDNSSFESLLRARISSKCFPISKNINSGETNWNLFKTELSRNTSNFLPLDNNTEYIILVSTTTNMAYSFDSLNLFANDSSVLSDNSLTSSSVNLDFETMRFSLASLNNSEVIVLRNINESSNCDNDLKFSSNSFGIVTRTSIQNRDCSNYINLPKENFSLMPITEAYQNIRNGNEIYFLNENGEKIRVLGIEKVPYSGKIYDVDVGNDVVLVRRGEKCEEVNSESLFVNPVVMVEVLEDNYSVLELENEDKVAELNSFEVAEVVPQILKVLDGNNVTFDNLSNLFVDSAGKRFVFVCKFVESSSQVVRDFEGESHNPISLSNSSNVNLECLPFSVDFNLSTYSSFNSNSSTGYQSSLSQNSWSSSVRVPVFVNLSNMSRFISLIALATNSESSLILPSSDTEFSIENVNGLNYINLWNSELRNQCSEPTAFWSGNSNNGTIKSPNAHITRDGKFGKGVYINGVDDNINGIDLGSPQVLNLTESLSISAWVRLEDNSISMEIFDRGADFGAGSGVVQYHMGHYQFDAGRIVIVVGNGSTTLLSSTNLVELNNWYHVVGTFNGTTTSIYLNGVLNDSDYSLGFEKLYAGSPLTAIGGSTGMTRAYWNGSIDEVIVFNRSLSAQEVKGLYDASAGRFWNNYTGLEDGTHTFKSYVVDAGGNLNSTEKREVHLDDTPPFVVVDYPRNDTVHYTNSFEINVTVSETGAWTTGIIDACLYSLDGAANVSMTKKNATFFNYTYAGVSHGLHNLTVSCNDTLNNFGYASVLNFDVNLLDLSVPNIILPTPLFPNATLIVINISNNGPPNATDVNVTCRMDGYLFESKVIPFIEGAKSFLTNCSWDFRSGNYTLNVTVDPMNTIPENKEFNNENISVMNAVIAIRNASSKGFTTNLETVNYNENVNLTLTVPEETINTTRVGYNLSAVWAQIFMPNGTIKNYSLVSVDGSRDGGIWNASFNHNGLLGDYRIKYWANLTGGFAFVENVTGNFSVKNTSITINAKSVVNTTETIPVNGVIRLFNGSSYEDLANNLFVISLNDVVVSSDREDYSDFSDGEGERVNATETEVKLALTDFSGVLRYYDDFTTTKYSTDAAEYYSMGFESGRIFELDSMTLPIGNVTYRYTTPTIFRNASVLVKTVSSSDGTTGNTSIHYSLNNETWTIANSTTLKGYTMSATLPVDGEKIFYVRLVSNTNNFNSENPVDSYEVNWTQYQYVESGVYNSSVISLPNVTYTVFGWDENSSEGNIILQFRESSDGSSWSAWSGNYTNHLGNSITSMTKQYIQFRAFLETANTNSSPILHSVNISFFNASTNSTGGYDFNITIPTDSLGVLPLKVGVVQSAQGIVGMNSTNLGVWANTIPVYNVVRDYTQANANYSVWVNFTRADTGELTNGTIVTTISNSSTSRTQTCLSGAVCKPSWRVPADLAFGNYTINISIYNETGFFINSSTWFEDYLEQRNTTGSLKTYNRTISDLTAGVDYQFYTNATLFNTGMASMNDVSVYVGAKHSNILSVTEITPCTRVYPGESCNATLLIVVDGDAPGGTYYYTLRANWTDNDGTISGGGVGYIQDTSYAIITLNATLTLSNYSVNTSVEHGNSKEFGFNVISSGTDSVVGVDLSVVEESLPIDWINLSSYYIAGLASGESRQIIVNVSIPPQTSPGNYSALINVSSLNGGTKYLNVTVNVPLNSTWAITPTTNFTYNKSFSLNADGEVANFTLFNFGNINLTMEISYLPSGTEDYLLYPGLFDGVNPTEVNVTKGENTTFSLNQNGWTEPLTDVGFIMEIFNESANPTTFIYEDSFTVSEQAPEVSDIFFYLDGVAGNVAEVNKNLTIKIRGTDDVGLNETATKVNVTYGGTTWVLNGTSLAGIFGEYTGGALKTVINYTANFTPVSVGVYNVSAIVYDLSGKAGVSAIYNFTAYGTTSLVIGKNATTLNTSSIDKYNSERFFVNYTINNTGKVNAYDLNLTFEKNGSILISPGNYFVGSLKRGVNLSNVFEVNVSRLTPPGNYPITANLKYMNPDGTNIVVDTTLDVIVASNKSMNTTQNILNLVVPSGSTNSGEIEINNLGNDLLTDIEFNCYTGEACISFSKVFNQSGFSIPRNSSAKVNVSFTASPGMVSGVYAGKINITESNISRVIDLSLSVPQTLAWTAEPLSLNVSRSAGSSGELAEIKVLNVGNTQLTIQIASTESSIVTPNVTNLSVEANTNSSFMIDYTAPEQDGQYFATITMSNSSATPTQLNVSVNLTATNLNLTIIYPTELNNLSNVIAGERIYIAAGVTFSGTEVTSGIGSWSAAIGGNACTNLSFDYAGVWSISCNAPAVADGKTHNLTLTATHNEHGSVERVSANSISYMDVSPPSFVNISRRSVALGSYINLSANITDNVAIDSVLVQVTSQNGTSFSGAMSYYNGLWNFSSVILSESGEYIVNYTANDTTGNLNSVIDWFEVGDVYEWNVTLRDSENFPVTGMNLILMRPNTKVQLANGVSDANGLLSIIANKRFYDLLAKLGPDSVLVRNVDFSNPDSFTLNLHRIELDDFQEGVSLHKVFTGIGSNSEGFDENSVEVTISYAGLNYESVTQLEIVKCEDWDYNSKSCDGNWIKLDSRLNSSNKTITGDSTGFSAYFLSENKCGNGLCELTYGESPLTCSDDCKSITSQAVSEGGGGSGASGGLSGFNLSRIEEIIRSFINIGGVKIETTSIYKELFAGDTASFRVKLINTLSRQNTIRLRGEGEVSNFLFFESSSVDMSASETRDVLVKLVIPKFTLPGNYEGDLIISSGSEEGRIPVTVKILSPEGKLLDVKIQPLKESVAPGESLQIQTDILNLGKTARVDVQFDLQLIDIESGEMLARTEEAFAVENTYSVIKEFKIPSEIPIGKYLIKATAYYSSLEQQDQQATAIAYVEVKYPSISFLSRRFLFVPVWGYLLGVLAIGAIVGSSYVWRYVQYRKKRFKVKVELSEAPHSKLWGI